LTYLLRLCRFLHILFYSLSHSDLTNKDANFHHKELSRILLASEATVMVQFELLLGRGPGISRAVTAVNQ
jgi:hypothetical protein